MPHFFTTVTLVAASDRDYAKLSDELKKYRFQPVQPPAPTRQKQFQSSWEFKSDNKSSLLQTTEEVSIAAASTGKKYSFIVIRDKDSK